MHTKQQHQKYQNIDFIANLLAEEKLDTRNTLSGASEDSYFTSRVVPHGIE